MWVYVHQTKKNDGKKKRSIAWTQKNESDQLYQIKWNAIDNGLSMEEIRERKKTVPELMDKFRFLQRVFSFTGMLDELVNAYTHAMRMNYDEFVFICSLLQFDKFRKKKHFIQIDERKRLFLLFYFCYRCCSDCVYICLWMYVNASKRNEMNLCYCTDRFMQWLGFMLPFDRERMNMKNLFWRIENRWSKKTHNNTNK